MGKNINIMGKTKKNVKKYYYYKKLNKYFN